MILREMKANDTYLEMQIAYKDNTPGQSTIYKWIKRFKDVRKTFENDPRTGIPINSEDKPANLHILEEQPFTSARFISNWLLIPKSTFELQKNLIFNEYHIN